MCEKQCDCKERAEALVAELARHEDAIMSENERHLDAINDEKYHMRCEIDRIMAGFTTKKIDMSNMHPVFADALRPFIEEQDSVYNNAMRELEEVEKENCAKFQN